MDTKKIPKVRKSTDLTQKEIAMLRSTSKLSDKEIKLWHAEFLRKYPTGQFDKNTFNEAIKELYPQDKTTTTVDALFNAIDTNNDGTVNFNEFLFFAAVNGHNGSLDERLDLMFDLWDVSNDGQIDQNELAHLISAIYDRSGVKDRHGEKNPHNRAKAIIQKLDVSGDKKLSREEFVNGCKNDEIIQKFLTVGQ